MNLDKDLPPIPVITREIRLAEIINTVWKHDSAHAQNVFRAFRASDFFNTQDTTGDLRHIIEGTDPYRKLSENQSKFACDLHQISQYYNWKPPVFKHLSAFKRYQRNHSHKSGIKRCLLGAFF